MVMEANTGCLPFRFRVSQVAVCWESDCVSLFEFLFIRTSIGALRCFGPASSKLKPVDASHINWLPCRSDILLQQEQRCEDAAQNLCYWGTANGAALYPLRHTLTFCMHKQ